MYGWKDKIIVTTNIVLSNIASFSIFYFHSFYFFYTKDIRKLPSQVIIGSGNILTLNRWQGIARTRGDADLRVI